MMLTKQKLSGTSCERKKVKIFRIFKKYIKNEFHSLAVYTVVQMHITI